jgi:hypothetical protein
LLERVVPGGGQECTARHEEFATLPVGAEQPD